MTTHIHSNPFHRHFQRAPLPSSKAPPIPELLPEDQSYEHILSQVNHGEVSPEVGAKKIADHIVKLVRECEVSPTRQQARLLRAGMRAISQLRDKTFYSKDSDKDRKMQKLIFETSKQAISCLVRQGHVSETEMYLKFGFVKEAYALLKEGKLLPPDPISDNLLSSLVPLAIAEKDDETLLALAERGASMAEVPIDVQTRLANRAVEGLQDNALRRLVSDGCPLHDKNGNSQLFLSAVSSNLLSSVESMINRHVNVHSHDEKGNSALHRALFLGNLDMISLLQHHIDPRTKNAEGHTPLEALIHAKDLNNDFLQLNEGDYPSFLQRLLERPQTAFQGILIGSEGLNHHLIRTGGKTLFPPPGDLIELAFLLNDTPFFFALLSEISPEEFHQSCHELYSKYPKASVEQFEFSHWQLDEHHFTTGCQHFAPPATDPETNPPLGHLLALFDTLNFTKPDEEHYIDPVAYLKEAREKDPEIASAQEAIVLLRGDLETFIKRFTTREHFYGTPVEGKPGFIEFFDQLTRTVKHIIAALEEKKEPAETQRALHEFISASLHCGGRYQETVLREYLKVCFGMKDGTPEETILKSLAELRFDLFEATISRIPEKDSHDFLDAQHNLGARLGIPGFKQVEDFNDPYSRIHRHDKRIEEEFRGSYTPHAIVSYLIQTMEMDAHVRDPYLHLHKIHEAPHWKLDRYGPILEELARIETSDDREEKEVRLMSLFDYYSIIKSPGQSNKDAVLEEQISDYLEHGVYDEQGHLQPQGVECILEKLGVFHSIFPKKPQLQLPSAEAPVIAAPVQQEPPAEGDELLSPEGLFQIPAEFRNGQYLF